MKGAILRNQRTREQENKRTSRAEYVRTFSIYFARYFLKIERKSRLKDKNIKKRTHLHIVFNQFGFSRYEVIVRNVFGRFLIDLDLFSNQTFVVRIFESVF